MGIMTELIKQRRVNGLLQSSSFSQQFVSPSYSPRSLRYGGFEKTIAAANAVVLKMVCPGMLWVTFKMGVDQCL